MAKKGGIGCGGLLLGFFALGIVLTVVSPDSETSPTSTSSPSRISQAQTQTTNPSAADPNVQECSVAFLANTRFVDILNELDSGEITNSEAALRLDEIETSLDAARKTVIGSGFQNGMLEHANIVGIAKMSLENDDRESYDFAVTEFIRNSGYFRPYCD